MSASGGAVSASEERRKTVEKIDFVIAWVDGNDPEWQARKRRLEGKAGEDDQPERYRDWGLLRYWFRGVEKFAPWCGKVFLVCDQEAPDWLRRDCDRLVIVRHEDYLPEAFRPAFSSHPVELNIHRIPGLSQRFVYFNDDMFLLRPVEETFFFRKGLPRDAALLNPVPTVDLKKRKGGRIFTIPLNNAEYLNRDFEFRSCIRAHPLKWLSLKYGKKALRNLMLLTWPRFVGFDELHLPQAFLKSAFEDAWDEDGDILAETSRHPLRDDRDVNQWLIRERQLAKGLFMPRSPKAAGKVFDLDLEGDAAARAIEGQAVPMVCLNDGPMEEEAFCRMREKVQDAFRKILPEPCIFEKEGTE